MPTVNNRRLLPLNGVMPMDGTPGEEDPNKENKDNKEPTDKEVPQEKANPSDDDDEEEEEEASEYESESEDSSSDDDQDEDDPTTWTRATLISSINYGVKQYEALKKRFQKRLDEVEQLKSSAATNRVKHQVALTSKNTIIANLRNQLKIQSESKATVRASYKKKYREDLDLLKAKNSALRKERNGLKSDLNKAQKESKQSYTEKENAKRKLTDLRFDFVEKTKAVTALNNANKKLKKELEKKTESVKKLEDAKLDAKVQIQKEKTERTRLLETERTARILLEQQAKDIDHQKKKELAIHNSKVRIEEKAKVRKKKDEEDKKVLKDQKDRMDSALVELHRSAPATRTSLPNNGEFHGMNSFMQLLQSAQQLGLTCPPQAPPPSTPAGNLPTALLRLGGASSGSSNDDAVSLMTQPTGLASPPARQLTLTQMDWTTPDRQPLPSGVQKLTDEASGRIYYRHGENFYMSYEAKRVSENTFLMDAPPPCTTHGFLF